MLLNIFVQIVNAGLQVYLALLFYSSFSKRKCPVSVLLAAAVGGQGEAGYARRRPGLLLLLELAECAFH